MLAALMILSTSCFGNSNASGGANQTPEALKPKPVVEKVIVTTNGIENAYYATLDITVKNDGAEGIINVIADVTQAGKTSNNEEMPVYLKQGQSHELKLTFPLVWKGGDFTSNVQAVVP